MKRVSSAGLGSVDGSGEGTADQLREDVKRTQEDLGQSAGGTLGGLTGGIAGTAARAKDALPDTVTGAPAKVARSAKLLVGMVGLTRLAAGAGSAVVAAGAVWGATRVVRKRRVRNRGLRGMARRIQRRR